MYKTQSNQIRQLSKDKYSLYNEYAGKRVKRGLVRSKDGMLINSDENGAINIARKSKVTVIQFNIVEQIKGIVAFPKRIRVANV